MSVVGRDEPLAQLDAFVRALPDGVTPLVVEGEPGIGKTTLWKHAVAAAQSAGYRVLAARAAEQETPLAYAALVDLLDRIELPLDELAPPQRAALEVALLLVQPTAAPDARAVFAGFTEVVRRLTADAPVLVAIDDRQWLDASTRRAVDFMSRRVGGSPVGVLVTQRTGTERPADADVLQLGPLSPGAVHALVKERTGVSLPRSTVLRVHEASRGNPFFALELAHALVDAGLPRAGDAWPVPDNLRDLVDARVGRVREEVRAKLVRAAARAGRTVDGLAPEEVADAERAGIVTQSPRGEVTFAHPLFASAIYASVDEDARRRVHAALARERVDLEERARHAALAAKEPDVDAANLVAEAAERARRRGAPDVAADLAARAARLTPPERAELRWRRRALAAEALFTAGDLEEAREELSRLVEVGVAGPERSWARRILAEANYRLGKPEEALRQLRAAADDADGDAAAGAAVAMDLAFALHQSFTSFSEARAQARRAVALAEEVGDNAVLAAALAVDAGMRFVEGGGIDHARLTRALALEDVDAAVPPERRPTFMAAMVLAYGDDLDRARQLLASLRTGMVERGQDAHLPQVVSHLAHVECNAGRLAEASRTADEARDLAELARSGSEAAIAAAFRALVAARAGDEAVARAAAADAIELAVRTGWQLAAFHAGCALVHLEVSLGRPEAALEHVRDSLAVAEAERVVEPARWPYLADAIEALIEVGDVDRATRLTDLLERRGHELDRTTAVLAAARSRALLAAAAGDLASATTALERVAARIHASPVPNEAARTLLVRGQVERRRKQKREARGSLEAAAALFDEIGARLWARRARDELARVHGAVDGELTATEARVAELAASGLTNREIAATAFMSQKTVEANLSRVYRKLGIRSRAELGLTLAGATPRETPAGRDRRSAG